MSPVVSGIDMRLSSLARCISHHNGGYAESTVSESRFPICGYLASSLRKLRRARDCEQFGQYRSLWAIKMSRTSGLARTFFDSPPEETPVLRFSRQNSGASFCSKDGNFEC